MSESRNEVVTRVKWERERHWLQNVLASTLGSWDSSERWQSVQVVLQDGATEVGRWWPSSFPTKTWFSPQSSNFLTLRGRADFTDSPHSNQVDICLYFDPLHYLHFGSGKFCYETVTDPRLFKTNSSSTPLTPRASISDKNWRWLRNLLIDS